ncbi:MAG: hypothetical protein KTR31_35800 [Myxococcales bacterium]|nr:hypothetical protein [Myxococcales bacterium]
MAKMTNALGQPYSGLVPWAVVGIVKENVDEKGLGRIQVAFPTLHKDEPLSFWIRCVAPMAGPERGFYALPEKEDEVLVLFVQGSQDVGVVIGQLWNGVDKPPTEAKDGLPGPDKTSTSAQWSTDTFADGSKTIETNDRRFWRSRSGHLLVFDDTEGAETVQIWDGSHTLAFVFDTANQRIVLSNTKGDVHIRTDNDLYLEAGNDIKWRAGNNIEGESGQDTVHKAGKDTRFEAAMNATFQGGQEVMLQSTGGNVTCKAAMTTMCDGGLSFKAKGSLNAEISGGPLTTVTGGMVKIN